jgi:hypothetical protein
MTLRICNSHSLSQVFDTLVSFEELEDIAYNGPNKHNYTIALGSYSVAGLINSFWKTHNGCYRLTPDEYEWLLKRRYKKTIDKILE